MTEWDRRWLAHVVDLLGRLVERGVLTRDEADALLLDAVEAAVPMDEAA